MTGQHSRSWLTDAQADVLASLLAEALGATHVAIRSLAKLSGGAIQENWLVDVFVEGGTDEGQRRFVLRKDAPSSVTVSLGRAEEYRVLQVAHAAGLRVPEPILLHEGPDLLGAPFSVMRFVLGEARGKRLVRDASLDGDALVAELAQNLALLHAVQPQHPELAFLPTPPRAVAPARVTELRGWLDTLAQPQPVLEWGLRWLERHPPSHVPMILVHSDFRTGNVLVHDGRLAAILDWEFARWGDPREDLGWFLARCWRFGAVAREAGGLGSRRAFLDAYEVASGRTIDRASLAWFELLATLRWATIALLQAERHRSGRERSLELALTAHVTPALELDILQAVDRLTSGTPA